MKTLKINSTNGYLNLPDLPHNCIFNKVVTGCGGTTVVLFNDESYIIAVPTTELIVNKTGLTESGLTTITSYDGKEQPVFGLFGTFTYQAKKELKKYASSTGIKKIMCTYDKMEYLEQYLNPTDFRLLIDEYHILLKAYSYRQKAVDGVLDCFRKYKSFCFMSATPISADFTPSILSDVELVEAQWDNTDTLIVKLDQTNHPYVKAANYINAYKKDGYLEINGNKSTEAYFFINSVTDIASILEYCQLGNEEVKIVCADNPSNRDKLAGYTISNSRSTNKPFTFITSKSFEGADYFSETGMCFVVSNSSNTNTLLDISTDIYQIAGRIRTESNPFRNIMVHIFNSSKKAKSMAEKMLNSAYAVCDKEGNYFLNDMLVKLDLYNFKLEKVIYNDGIALRKEHNANGNMTTELEYERLNETMNKAGKKLSFKDAFLRYTELLQNMVITPETDEIVRVQPLVVPAYHKLGTDKVRSLRYIKTAIEKALISLESDKNRDTKIVQILSKQIKTGFFSNADIKSWIREAYDILGITDKVKATDLDRWFDCKPVAKWIDSKTVKGYEIYRPKIVFK